VNQMTERERGWLIHWG